MTFTIISNLTVTGRKRWHLKGMSNTDATDIDENGEESIDKEDFEVYLKNEG